MRERQLKLGDRIQWVGYTNSYEVIKVDENFVRIKSSDNGRIYSRGVGFIESLIRAEEVGFLDKAPSESESHKCSCDWGIVMTLGCGCGGV